MDFWRASSLEDQIDVAAGRQEADLVLKGGHVFNENLGRCGYCHQRQ